MFTSVRSSCRTVGEKERETEKDKDIERA